MDTLRQISTISIIGTGNVATALGIAFSEAGIEILEIVSKNINNAKSLAKKVNCNYVKSIAELNKISDLYIIATPDSEIKNIVPQLAGTKGIIVHTSGSQPIELLSSLNNSFGVFYPLQTFTKNKTVDFKDIPICIEGSDKETQELLTSLAEIISSNVVILNSEQRQYLHLTAVTVNNFTNHLYSVAHDILKKEDMDFSLLLPLIKETAIKIHNINPEDAQTGPAHRNDLSTINKHMELLSKYPEYKDIYSMLSNQIIKKHHD